MAEVMSGASLERALNEKTFDRPSLEVVGMVKSAEREGFVSVTRTDCESWVELPTDSIEQAEHLGNRRCKNHDHPVFRLSLKAPDNPEAQILAALLGSPTSASAPSGFSGIRQEGFGQPTYRRGPLAPQGATRFASASPQGFPGASSFARVGVYPRGGIGGSQGLAAWGCWDSECCDCIVTQCLPTGDGREYCWCAEMGCSPCERCIWPW